MSRDKALAAIHNVPIAPTPDFTGRADELDKLQQLFDARVTGTAIVAVHGLGGVGKTQLALRYARSCASGYDVIWWVRAEHPSTLAADFADLAAALRLSPRGETDQRAAIDAAKRWLARSARWLVVFDSVRDPRDIEPYLVPGALGQVLVTSRHASWVGIARLHLRGLRRPDAVELLLSRSGMRDRTTRDQTRAANELAEVLGDLPLALSQAAAFMEERAYTVEAYLALFRERQQELMRAGAASETAPTVATTWDIAFREISAREPAAAELLALCAFLAPDDIPRDDLRTGASACPEALAHVLRDPIALGDQVRALRRYSLIEAQDDALGVHRLVQAVVRERFTDADRKAWSLRAASLVNQIYPTDIEDKGAWHTCRRWLPHVRTVAERAGAAGAAQETVEPLLHRAASYCRHVGMWTEARDLYLRAIALAIPLHGEEHHEVAALERGLALTIVLGGLRDAGSDPEKARHLAEHALSIHERADPGGEPSARDHAALVRICRELGDKAGVEHHIAREIEIYEKIYGAEDPRLLHLLNDRGFILREKGDRQGARVLFERALSLGKPYDPDVATIHSNLASLLDELGERQAAKHHARRAVEISERFHGAEHYAVAIRRNNLATVLFSMGELEGAKAELEKAIAIARKVYGSGHRRMVMFENNLAKVQERLQKRAP